MAISLLIAAGTGGRAEVANRPNPEPVRDLLQIYGIDDQSIGYVVYDIAARKRLAARGSDRFFIPASTMKVPTTILALDSLGAEFRFDTAIATTGSVRNGVLHGDLYLRGGGDPQLTHDDFEGFVARLKTLGIAKVAGKFVYDTTLYTGLDVLQPEQPDDAAYNPGIDALSINFNRVKVAWQTPKKPAPMNLTVSSVTDRAPIPIDFVTVAPAPPGTPAKYHFTFVPGKPNDAWLMATQISRQGSAWLPVRRPALHAARVLQLMARQAGIDLPDPKQGATPSDAAIVYRHGSPPLASSVEAMLKYSNNLMAEMV
ncbi:MAG: D-alanyl-D-alanine carboxypeptidase/D-alanyl-D-alanine-endopeptidase, partial [Alphaproteobacteria bacterium]